MANYLALAPARVSTMAFLTELRLAGTKLRQPTRELGLQASLVYLLAFGIVGDALTTVWGMQSGVSEEANSVALSGMLLIGLPAYIGLVGLMCSLLAPVLLLSPRTVFGAAALGTATLITAYKVWMVVGNARIIIESHFQVFPGGGLG